jgi:hypothetical protein
MDLLKDHKLDPGHHPTDNGPQNLTMLHQLALNIARADKTKDQSPASCEKNRLEQSPCMTGCSQFSG